MHRVFYYVCTGMQLDMCSKEASDLGCQIVRFGCCLGVQIFYQKKKKMDNNSRKKCSANFVCIQNQVKGVGIGVFRCKSSRCHCSGIDHDLKKGGTLPSPQRLFSFQFCFSILFFFIFNTRFQKNKKGIHQVIDSSLYRTDKKIKKMCKSCDSFPPPVITLFVFWHIILQCIFSITIKKQK